MHFELNLLYNFYGDLILLNKSSLSVFLKIPEKGPPIEFVPDDTYNFFETIEMPVQMNSSNRTEDLVQLCLNHDRNANETAQRN